MINMNTKKYNYLYDYLLDVFSIIVSTGVAARETTPIVVLRAC
jgi:hypothetical protein